MNSSSTASSSVPASDSTRQTPRLRAFPPIEEMATDGLISATNLHKSYRKGKLSIPVLRGVDFAAEEGKITAIVGQSGSGRVRCFICLERWTSPMKVRSILNRIGSTIFRVEAVISFAINNLG